jgi:hypothetical protein
MEALMLTLTKIAFLILAASFVAGSTIAQFDGYYSGDCARAGYLVETWVDTSGREWLVTQVVAKGKQPSGKWADQVKVPNPLLRRVGAHRPTGGARVVTN